MLGIDIQQIFLHLLNFGILFGGLYFILYNPVKKFMDKRVEYYKQMDEEASKKLDEAEALKAEREESLSTLQTEISEKRAEADKELNSYREARTKAAKEEAQKIIDNATAAAQREHDRIIEQSSSELTDLAVKAAKKVMDEPVSDTYDRFLNAAEKELENEQ
ncbi:MAG: ATP synthase F0 subunit B [Lachnospiraceae bacterium]|nr:ATP synthase F0 subunit B [Lachnospiraceae bacterium]